MCLRDSCIRVGSNRLNKRVLTTLIGSGAMDSIGDRKKLFNLIDPVLKKAEQTQERSESQIQDLFSDDLSEDKEIDLKGRKEEDFDILANEWSSLGFYLESHPIEGKREEVRKMCGLFISELKKRLINRESQEC